MSSLHYNSDIFDQYIISLDLKTVEQKQEYYEQKKIHFANLSD